jgi:hypothetical protein
MVTTSASTSSIARDEAVSASARWRAVEVLMRLGKATPPEEEQWQQIVASLAAAERADAQ